MPIPDLRGPWTLDPRSDMVLTQPATGRPHGAVVASIGNHPGFIERATIGPVVAAAPDLLAALRDAVLALAMCQPRTEHGARCQHDAILKGNAAIAAAEGRP